MAKMIGAHLAICNGGRACSCNPGPKAAKSYRRSIKRRERAAFRRDVARGRA